MCLHRPFADYEGFGDFGIGVPSGDELKDLLFATCEGGETSQFRCRATTGEDGWRLDRDVIQPAVLWRAAAPAAVVNLRLLATLKLVTPWPLGV